MAKRIDENIETKATGPKLPADHRLPGRRQMTLSCLQAPRAEQSAFFRVVCPLDRLNPPFVLMEGYTVDTLGAAARAGRSR